MEWHNTDLSEDEQNQHEATARKRSSRGKVNLLSQKDCLRYFFVFQRAINVAKLKANANDRP